LDLISRKAQIIREIQIPQIKKLWNSKNETGKNTVGFFKFLGLG
jgi:hypothetical protein